MQMVLEILSYAKFVCKRLSVDDFQADGKKWHRKPLPNASRFPYILGTNICRGAYIFLYTYFFPSKPLWVVAQKRTEVLRHMPEPSQETHTL